MVKVDRLRMVYVGIRSRKIELQKVEQDIRAIPWVTHTDVCKNSKGQVYVEVRIEDGAGYSRTLIKGILRAMFALYQPYFLAAEDCRHGKPLIKS